MRQQTDSCIIEVLASGCRTANATLMSVDSIQVSSHLSVTAYGREQALDA